MMGAVLNGFLLADFHSIIAIDRWRSRYRDRMPAWLDRIFAFDELNSFAGFAFNHPGYCYPDVIGKPLEAPDPFLAARQFGRSDERRVGTACDSTVSNSEDAVQ